MKIDIIKVMRSGVSVEVDGEPLTIDGEAYLRGHGSPDMVLYSNSLAPGTTHLADFLKVAENRSQVIAEVIAALKARGMSCIAE